MHTEINQTDRILLVSLLVLMLYATPSFSTGSKKGIIHMTTVQDAWCGNMAVSKKVGHKIKNGRCVYVKETAVRAYDTCGPFRLNAYSLEMNAGKGFNCAATHVYSNVTHHVGLDEYMLISDEEGHYIHTEPYERTLILSKESLGKRSQGGQDKAPR
jgi:hypothetical protein